MARNFFDPGGGKGPPSYASRVKSTINKHQKLDRNVLDIIIEKNNKDQIIHLNGDEVARVCTLVGIHVGGETEGYQVNYSGKVITLSVWAKPAVSLERFVSEEAKALTPELTITSVRPAVKREVTVLVTGLHFNTSDDMVKEYLECFGAKVSGSEPVYGVHKEGPWKGQYNGDRRYKADFSGQLLSMGTYHLLGGAKVRVV